MGSAANPGLARAAAASPVVVSGTDCVLYNPFSRQQEGRCGPVLDHLSKRGVPYSAAPAASVQDVTVGNDPVDVVWEDEAQAAASYWTPRLDSALAAAGYDLSPVRPGPGRLLVIFLAIVALGALSGATYGPVAALLSEMFPPEIRYSSLSMPYHLGTGYFGGFLPFISQYIVARTGDPYAGLWYTMAIVAMALVVTLWGLKETRLA